MATPHKRTKRAPHKRTKRAQPPRDTFPKVIETFIEPSIYSQPEPNCINSIVRVTLYRVTIERVEEPIEVIHDRIRKLWRESDNHHDWQPLRQAAARYGLTLDPEERGKDCPQ